jgi:hypothetical protein
LCVKQRVKVTNLLDGNHSEILICESSSLLNVTSREIGLYYAQLNVSISDVDLIHSKAAFFIFLFFFIPILHAICPVGTISAFYDLYSTRTLSIIIKSYHSRCLNA